MRVEQWRACKRIFHGAHPWALRCVEDVTGHEGAGVGAVAVLTRDAVGPRSLVPAFFALAGAWRRAACEGWVRGDQSPARRDDLEATWVSLRAEIEGRGRGELTAIDGEATRRRAATVMNILGWELRGADQGACELVITARRTGFLTDAGARTEARRLVVALSRPWSRGLSFRDQWNDQFFLAEGPDHFTLFVWSTSA